MKYHVVWHENALEDLRELDPKTAKKIISRVRDYLTENPHHLGKALTGIFKGLYRYRFGDFRVIYAISREEIIITIVRVSLRRDAYR